MLGDAQIGLSRLRRAPSVSFADISPVRCPVEGLYRNSTPKTRWFSSSGMTTSARAGISRRMSSVMRW